MLYHRIITAIIGGSIFVGLLYLGESWTLGLTVLLSALGMFEASEIIFEKRKFVSVFSGILGGVICFLHILNLYLSLTIILILVTSTFLLSDRRFRWLSIWLAYFPLAMSKLTLFRNLDHGFLILLSLLALVWVEDSVAYFTGLSIGKRRLWQEVSPGKTWEGTVSGISAGSLAFAIFSFFLLSKNFFHMLVAGFFLSVAAIIGDLFESSFKRTFEVKDSGKFLPGHGGILDRFDSLAFASLSLSLLLRFIW